MNMYRRSKRFDNIYYVILYKLPFPEDVCSQIFRFTCKSRFSGLLGVASLQFRVEGVQLPERDEDVVTVHWLEDDYPLGNDEVRIELTLYDRFTNLAYLNLEAMDVDGDIKCLGLLRNMQEIRLGETSITGNIADLTSLPKLTVLSLWCTSVTGDLRCLRLLPNLTTICLWRTKVFGDIASLTSMTTLIAINVIDTRVRGDVNHLRTLPLLNEISCSGYITGSEQSFHDYRARAGLKKCSITSL